MIETPFLEEKLKKNKLGKVGNFALNYLYQAIKEPDIFSTNDIRNYALTDKNLIKSQGYLNSERLLNQLGNTNMIDTGQAGKMMTDLAGRTSMLGNLAVAKRINDLEKYNAMMRAQKLSDAINFFNQWSKNRMRRRLSDTQSMIYDLLSKSQGKGSGWLTGSALLGGLSNLFSAIGG
ncbi:MAG: hypothetical protein QXJ06_00625 [Candidatus Aenigmatarchaeota archaeon]